MYAVRRKLPGCTCGIGPKAIRPSGPRHRVPLQSTSRAIATATQPKPTPSGSARQADQLVRASFDDAELWRSISLSQHSPAGGLFGHPALRKPDDFEGLAERTARRAELLVERICSDPDLTNTMSPEESLLHAAKQFDRLSDLLCGVIDMAEAVRNVHPDSRWVAAAEDAYDLLCRYMNVLNTHVGLYEALRRVLQPFRSDTIAPGMTIDLSSTGLFPAYTVALQFLHDFEKSGIHLPPQARAQFVTLSDAIIQLGRRFVNESPSAEGSPKRTLKVSVEDVSALGQAVAARLQRASRSRLADMFRTKRVDFVEIEADSWEAQALTRHPDVKVRQRAFEFLNAAEPDRISTLETLLRTRGELAQLVGCESWAQVALIDKMAKTPENVMTFLRSLSESNRPRALADLKELSVAKARHLSIAPDDPNAKIQVWDREVYSQRYLMQAHPAAPPSSIVGPYLSVGTIIQGLSRLFTTIYGISFQINDGPLDEQLWHPSVRKLDVVDESEGLIGTIYCDLFARESKPPSAAHYTVRCSRRVDDDQPDLDFAAHDIENLNDYRSLDTQGRQLVGRQGLYQLPVIVLSCDFDEPSLGKPGFMTWQDVETLFHEVGHALHSMIGRTTYHNVSGTRCATDFVELPSILMEHFVASDEVAPLFARHYETDKPMPSSLLHGLRSAHNSLSALETNAQITMAALDQVYHSPEALKQDFSSTKTLYRVQEEFSVIPPALGTAWQGRFGHLVGYGATYYSYLFDRAIASRVWSAIFSQDPLSSLAGERYKNEVLAHGGGRDPWECVGALLNDSDIAKGDVKAMAKVGHWGVAAG